MIDMDKKEQILHYYRVDGLSLREISRRVGLNRKTVTRYVREYESSVKFTNVRFSFHFSLFNISQHTA